MRRHAAVALLALAAALAATADSPRPGADKAAVRKVALDELSDAFRTNDAYTDEHFTGKTLEIRGEIDQVTRTTYDGKDGYQMTMHAPGGGGLAVVCLFEGRKGLVPLKPPVTVTVRGLCGGTRDYPNGGEYVRFIRCEVIGTEARKEAPAATYTPEPAWLQPGAAVEAAVAPAANDGDKKLDRILEKLEKIEKRLSRIEKQAGPGGTP